MINYNRKLSNEREIQTQVPSHVVRLLDFHNRSSKIIVQEVSIDDRL